MKSIQISMINRVRAIYNNNLFFFSRRHVYFFSFSNDKWLSAYTLQHAIKYLKREPTMSEKSIARRSINIRANSYYYAHSSRDVDDHTTAAAISRTTLHIPFNF